MKRENTPLNIIERENSRISLICSVVTLVALAVILRLLSYQIIEKPKLEGEQAQERAVTLTETEAAAPVRSTATVVAVGDNLFHSSVYESGRAADDSLNYDHLYVHVKDLIQAADLAIVDEETMFTDDRDLHSFYPLFATPTEAGDALVEAGFDVVECATNHADDYGTPLIEETLNFWRTQHPEITVLGIHDSPEDAEKIKVREVNGIRIAFLDYTYGTNSGGPPSDAPYVLDSFGEGSSRVASMVKKAREQADCVIFIAHWGMEGEAMPTEYEKQWATFLMKQGVDVLIGGHPHILQPCGRLADNAGHDMVIFYSLGNFISAQINLEELLEGMACFTIQKTEENGNVSIEILDPVVKPMVMHYDLYAEDKKNMSVYMLEDYTDELALQHSDNGYLNGLLTVKNLGRKFQEIMSINVMPSSGTELLDVYFGGDGEMYDAYGGYVEDTASITEYQYYSEKGIDIENTLYSDKEIDFTADPDDTTASGGTADFDDTADYDNTADYDDTGYYEEEEY